MKLCLEYLKERHTYWIEEIGKTRIWSPSKFLPVTIVIRRQHRRYNGLFHRRWIKGDKERTLVDKIIIYNNSDDFEPVFLDSVLVHEMIHQYIIQNGIKDTRTHGKVFKDFMEKINMAFAGRLLISTKAHNPSIPTSGLGETSHVLLLIYKTDEAYCCVINSRKIIEFDNMVSRNKKRWKIKDFRWAISNDIYFNSFRRCTRALHGIKISLQNLESFYRKYNVELVNKYFI